MASRSSQRLFGLLALSRSSALASVGATGSAGVPANILPLSQEILGKNTFKFQGENEFGRQLRHASSTAGFKAPQGHNFSNTKPLTVTVEEEAQSKKVSRSFGIAALAAAVMGALVGTASADAPEPWQIGFQDPATSAMEAITDLHHDLFFFMIVIFSLVAYLLARICTSFHYTKQPIPMKFTHHTNLELIWAILPSLIIILIALPSLTLIYSFDDRVDKPAMTVKVVGRQWYWSYEAKEHVRYALARPSRLLELE